MSFRNERFNASCLSLDELAESIDPAKSRIFSDQGDGAERICRAVEWGAARPDSTPCRAECVADARRRLVEVGLERLVPVLEQVVANGRNRRESIAQLCRIWRRKWSGTRRKYYRGVQDLLTFFSANKIKGETNP